MFDPRSPTRPRVSGLGLVLLTSAIKNLVVKAIHSDHSYPRTSSSTIIEQGLRDKFKMLQVHPDDGQIHYCAVAVLQQQHHVVDQLELPCNDGAKRYVCIGNSSILRFGTNCRPPFFKNKNFFNQGRDLCDQELGGKGDSLGPFLSKDQLKYY